MVQQAKEQREREAEKMNQQVERYKQDQLQMKLDNLRINTLLNKENNKRLQANKMERKKMQQLELDIEHDRIE